MNSPFDDLLALDTGAPRPHSTAAGAPASESFGYPDATGIMGSPVFGERPSPMDDWKPEMGTYAYLKAMQFDARAERQAENERIDNRAAMKIRVQQLRAESDARQLELETKLGALAQELKTPPPKLQQAAMRPEEMYASLLGGIVTGDFAGAANAGHSIATQRTDLENQNLANEYNARIGTAKADYEIAQKMLLGEQSYRRQIDNQEIDTLQQQLVFDQQTARSLRTAWESSNDPGEIRAAARILQQEHPEFAPSEEEVAAKIRASGEKSAKAYNEAVESVWKNASTISETDRMRLEAWRQSLADPNDGYGLPVAQLMEVPTSTTLGKARLDESTRHNKALEEQSKKKFEWEKDTAFKQKMQLAWFNANTARASYTLAAQRNDLASMEFYRKLYSDQSVGAMVEIGKKISGLKGQIAGKEAEVKVAKGKALKTAEADLANLRATLQYWQNEAQTTNTDRLGLGLGSIDPEQMLKEALDFAQNQRSSKTGDVPLNPLGEGIVGVGGSGTFTDKTGKKRSYKVINP